MGIVCRGITGFLRRLNSGAADCLFRLTPRNCRAHWVAGLRMMIRLRDCGARIGGRCCKKRNGADGRAWSLRWSGVMDSEVVVMGWVVVVLALGFPKAGTALLRLLGHRQDARATLVVGMGRIVRVGF